MYDVNREKGVMLLHNGKIIFEYNTIKPLRHKDENSLWRGDRGIEEIAIL